MRSTPSVLQIFTASTWLLTSAAQNLAPPTFAERRTQEGYCADNCEVDCDTLTECNFPGFDPSYLGDGFCDHSYGCYNHKICGFDGGDCCTGTCPPGTKEHVNQDYECGSNGYACRLQDNCSKKEIRLNHFCNFGSDPLFTQSADDAEEIEVKFVLAGNKEYYPTPEQKQCGPLNGGTESFAAQRFGREGSRAWYCRIPVDSCFETTGAPFVDPAPLYTIKVGVDETDNEAMSEMVSAHLSPTDWYAGDCRDYQIQLYVPYDRSKPPVSCYVAEGGGFLEESHYFANSCLSVATPYENTYLLIFDVRSV